MDPNLTDQRSSKGWVHRRNPNMSCLVLVGLFFSVCQEFSDVQHVKRSHFSSGFRPKRISSPVFFQLKIVEGPLLIGLQVPWQTLQGIEDIGLRHAAWTAPLCARTRPWSGERS